MLQTDFSKRLVNPTLDDNQYLTSKKNMSAILGRIEMCGQPIDREHFLARFEGLRPYGPDTSECWVEGPIALGRHLLRIAAASSHERLSGPIDGVVVVADAILDNREELSEALGICAREAALMSDTELIRRSFLRWGPDCPERLMGDFAFAAIRPATQEVFLARDHVGARPLFWALRNNTVIFSSSIESMTEFDDWPWRINDRSIAEYLIAPTLPVTAPFFRDIHAVPAGGSVVLSKTLASTCTWWNPSAKSSRRFKLASDAVDECRILLERAVYARANTECAIGAHFSGGIDSSGVAILASRALNARNRNLSRGYAWSPSVSSRYPVDHARDERARIQDLAQLEGIPVHFGLADGANFLDFIQRPMEFESEADLADEIPVQRAAQEDGVRVLLSGWGGDHAFSPHGQGHFAGLLLSGKLNGAKRFARSWKSNLRRPDVMFQTLWREVIRPTFPHALHKLSAPLYFKNRSFAASRLLQEHSGLIWRRCPLLKFGLDPNQNLKTDFTAGHITMRLQAWATQSAQFGFQYRYPLTDRRLVEFLFTLAPEQIYLNDQPRGMARAVLADCIPKTLGKDDIANERMRADARYAAWRALAQRAADGEFDDECPWLDTKAFRKHVAAPMEQTAPQNVLAFYELFAAARVWATYRRATERGWV